MRRSARRPRGGIPLCKQVKPTNREAVTGNSEAEEASRSAFLPSLRLRSALVPQECEGKRQHSTPGARPPRVLRDAWSSTEISLGERKQTWQSPRALPQRWGENTACSHWEARLPQLCSGPGPHQPAGGQGSKPTSGWDGLPASCLTWIFVTIYYLSLESLKTLEKNPHMVAPGLLLLWVQEPQEESDKNPGILGPTCPQLADQDPNLEGGKPMRAGPFLSEVEVSPRP